MLQHHRLSNLCLGMLMILLLVGCSGFPAKPPKLELQPCRLAEFDAQCGTLSVFEDRAARSGPKIDLNVAVIKARGTDPAPDAIFWLAGGPGGAATDDAAYAMQLLGSLNDQRDLVFVDQRGTGGSNPLTCPKPDDAVAQVDDLRACLAGVEGDVGAYTTAWGMDDVDDVRAALGYDQVNLYGGSYGATAVQVYILRHGDHVRSAAVNGVSLLEVPMFERYPENSQAALDFLFARCEKDGTCSAAYPDLRQEFAAVLARLEQGPLTVPFDDPATGEPAVLTSELFKTNIHSLLVDTQLAPMAPKFIHLLYTEDWEALEAFLAPFLNAPRETSAWTLMSLNIMCHEDWAKMRPAETAASDPGFYLGYAEVRALTVPEDICAALPEPPAAALYGPLEKSDVPILLINGEADPQDPPANVADARERYPNSLGLVAPGQGHAYTGLPCQSAILTDFIASGSTSGLQTDCLAKVGLPAFAK